MHASVRLQTLTSVSQRGSLVGSALLRGVPIQVSSIIA